MSAGTKQISIEERDWRSSAGADDIGLGGNGHGVGGCDCDLTVLFFYEAFGPGTRSSANQHTLEIPEQRQYSEMCARLATCTENSSCGGGFESKEFRCNCRSGGGAQIVKIVSWN